MWPFGADGGHIPKRAGGRQAEQGCFRIVVQPASPALQCHCPLSSSLLWMLVISTTTLRCSPPCSSSLDGPAPEVLCCVDALLQPGGGVQSPPLSLQQFWGAAMVK
ncbi:Hypothetical predicted protein [Podarcis lilfordi]|uniref:Uncharacterized protein n=1 Tax=Podarcis lilfordi TaxID=74358 RepID=A0AA35KKZ5_9SAUR|nr:Hypothetical predicted protein [Podarcis lilfordi]